MFRALLIFRVFQWHPLIDNGQGPLWVNSGGWGQQELPHSTPFAALLVEYQAFGFIH
jgi:hypothetical protein